LGCSIAAVPDPTVVAKFFDIVYFATGSRDPTSTGPFTPVQGLFQVKFSQDQTTTSDNGTFTMHYTNYEEPQFCPFNQNCVCSGGTSGTFTSASTTTATPSPSASASPIPYDPNSTYVPTGGTPSPSPTIDPTTGLPTVATIYTYFFAIDITAENLTSGCKPESNRTLTIIRYSDGTLIMTNDYRQQFLTPQIVSN